MVFDVGSSSVVGSTPLPCDCSALANPSQNKQTQVMYLNDAGELLKSQSLFESNWKTGEKTRLLR